MALNGLRSSLPNLLIVHIDAAHARLSREGNELGMVGSQLSPSKAVLLFGEHHNAASLRGFVGQTGELSGIYQILHLYIGKRNKLHRLAVTEGDGARFIQQNGVNISG